MVDLLVDIDQTILLWINGLNSDFLDDVMWWISGKFTWWPFYLLLLLAVFYFKGWKKGAWLILMVVMAIVLSDQSSVHLFKNIIQRLRPSHNPELEGALHFVNGYRGGKFGFISSHASNSFAVATLISLVIRVRWFSMILFLWAGLVSISRVYLGVHYPSDIIAGAIWGGLIAWFLAWIYKKYLVKESKGTLQ